MNARKIWFPTWAAASLVVASCWPGCSCGSDPDAAPPVPHTHDAPPAAAPAAPPLDLDADTPGSDAPTVAPDDLIGTSWRAGDLEFTFEPNGVVRVRDDRPEAPDRAPGSWKLTGAQLTIRLDDYEYVFEAQGPTIRYGDAPLQRVLP